MFVRRIKAIETSVADLRQGQIAIHQSLTEVLQQLRAGSVNHGQNSIPSFRPSPSAYAGGSFSLSTSACTTPTGVDASSDLRHAMHSVDGSGYHGQNVLPPMTSSQQRQAQRPTTAPYRSPSIGSGSGARLSADIHPPHLPPPNGAYPTPTGMMYPPGVQGPMLPPISTFQDIGRQSSAANVSSVRYHSGDTSPRQHAAKAGSMHNSGRRSPKRKAAGSSNVTSTNTSDYEDEDNGELPSKGLVAPWEVLRGLAEVAAERAAHVRSYEPVCAFV